jgi:small-conductance mechanosensitive channel
VAEILSDPRTIWALAIVILLPVSIIAAGEVEERLRQRDSSLTRVASVIRQWTIPLLAIWILAVGLFDAPRSNFLVRLLGSGLLISLLAVVLMVIGLLIGRLTRRPDDDRRRLPQLLLALPKVASITVAGWVLVDGIWGVDLSAALTALGVTSLVVSFALQDTLSGLASGFLLLADAPFAPGDWIEAGEVEGRVVDIKWRSSRIETRNGDVLVVPNAYLAGAVVTNFDQPSRLHRVVVPVQVAFSNPPTLAKEMLLAAAGSVEHVLADPPPTVRIVQIDDPLMGYEVHLWIDDYTHAPKVASDFGSLVWYQSHRHEVPLPSPAYDIFLHDTSEAEVPQLEDSVERLRKSPLLAQLPEEELARLAESSRLVRFQQGEAMIDPAARQSSASMLWQGSAAIVIPGAEADFLEVTRLEQGDLFGLLAPSEDWPRSILVRALEDCEVVVLAEQVVGEVASRNMQLSAALNQIVASRTRRIERLMAQISSSSSAEPGVPT